MFHIVVVDNNHLILKIFPPKVFQVGKWFVNISNYIPKPIWLLGSMLSTTTHKGPSVTNLKINSIVCKRKVNAKDIIPSPPPIDTVCFHGNRNPSLTGSAHVVTILTALTTIGKWVNPPPFPYQSSYQINSMPPLLHPAKDR